MRIRPRTEPRRSGGGPGLPRMRIPARPGHRRAASRRTVFAFAALGLGARASGQPTLPYTPTTILLPPDGAPGSGTAYIFTPSGDNPHAVDFLALNVSSLRASSLQPTKLTSTLPFLGPDAGNCSTFAPSILRNGTITVFAGDCFAGSASSLWTYTPKTQAWTRHAITPSSAWDNAQNGPYHLGGIVTFSPQLSPVLSPPTLYLYGGMCPSPEAGTDTTWQTKATYSNRMLRLTPSSSSSSQPNNASYVLDYASPKGQQPPVAEAGFTFTELTPSLTNRTTDDGRHLVTQQTSHVLLGGHTQNAFVNMSTAAVWSLPEETWSFVGIAPPSSGRTDLAATRRGVSSVTSVDSRSGHTAVLSEDGTRLVVYGGWVGDVKTAAQPQLAVIKVGVGLGDWGWEVPEQQEGSEGSGVYGHGAVVLPGNVMMVYGGFEISGDGGEVKRRQAGRGKMFYNITSMTWSDEYQRPLAGGGSTGSGGGSTGSGGSSSGGSTTHGGSGSGGGSSNIPGSTGDTDSPDPSRKKQIGLGVGLGVGLLILAILAALGFRWFRRRQKRRAARDKTLRDLAQGVNGSLPHGLGEDDEMLERDHNFGIFPWTAAAAREWYTGGPDPYAQGRRSLGFESLRGGSRPGPSLYIPPPPSASSFSGRPRGAKGLYQPTNSYDFTPLNRTPNRIEPIYEADEDEEGDLGKGYPLSPDKEDRDDDDPFLTPTLNTPTGNLFPPPSNHSSPRHSNSPTPPPNTQPQSQAPVGGGGEGQEQHADVQGWVSDVEAASSANILTSRPSQRKNQNPVPSTTTPVTATGRVSPLRRGPGSTKSARHSLVSGPTDSSSSIADDASRTGSNLSERSAFSFARSDRGAAGAEDRVLLSRLRNTLATTTANTNERAGSSGGSSNSGSGNSYHTARSGTLNFPALQAEGPSLLLGSTAGSNNRDDGSGVQDDEDDFVHIPGSPSKHKPRRSWFGSLRRVFSGGTPESGSSTSLGNNNNNGAESPTREGLLWQYDAGGGSSDYDGRLYGGSGIGGLQRRRGQQQSWLGGGRGDDGGEWDDGDLERAAEQRTVQIMFTVPKEPLRVVNAEVEREESVLIVDPEDEKDDSGGSSSQADNDNTRDGPSKQEDGLLTPPHLELPTEDKGKATANRLSTATLEPPAGISPSPSLRASSITSATLHTAETVRLERPRTRVLEMVESIESRSSREGSPAGSPVRGGS